MNRKGKIIFLAVILMAIIPVSTYRFYGMNLIGGPESYTIIDDGNCAAMACGIHVYHGCKDEGASVLKTRADYEQYWLENSINNNVTGMADVDFSKNYVIYVVVDTGKPNYEQYLRGISFTDKINVHMELRETNTFIPSFMSTNYYFISIPISDLPINVLEYTVTLSSYYLSSISLIMIVTYMGYSLVQFSRKK